MNSKEQSEKRRDKHKRRKHKKENKEAKNKRNQQYRDYKEYEEKRREEANVKKLRLKKLQELILKIFPDAEKWAPKIICLIDLNFRNHSYRGYAAYLKEHPGSAKMYGLTKLPAKSTMQAWATDLASTTSSMMKILGLQAGEDACGTLLGDSSGFSKVKYEDWDDAKRGVVSRRGFNKLHILIVPWDDICTCGYGRTQTRFSHIPKDVQNHT